MPAPDRRAAARAIREFLAALGRDEAREPQLIGTPERVANAWVDELLEGEGVDPGALLEEGSMPAPPAQKGQLVVLRDLDLAFTCPHHLMPALGLATVAYVAGERLAGLGVIAQALDALAHRLTLQEDIGQGLSDVLVARLGARGAACRLRARHGCLSARGERKRAVVETLATAGSLAPGGTDTPLLASLLVRNEPGL